MALSICFGGNGGGIKLLFLNKCRSWRLSGHGNVWKFLGNIEEIVGGMEIIKSNFIINFHVFLFLGVGSDFEILIAISQ